MKIMKSAKMLVVLMALVFIAGPVMADSASVGVPEKPKSFIKFMGEHMNIGLDWRILKRKYEEYRQGRLPKATLAETEAR